MSIAAQCPLGEQYEQQIEAYHDGELADETLAEVSHHLGQCPACAAKLAELQAMSGLFAAESRPHLSQISNARLHARMDDVIRRGQTERELMRITRAFGAMAACVVVAGSVWLSQLHNTQLGNTSVATVHSVEGAPPWVEVASAADSDPVVRDAATPVAALYLASASGRSDDNQQ